MKKTILALSVALLPTSVLADTVYGKVTNVDKVFVDRYVERVERQCNDVEVPIYGRAGGGSNAGDVLGGMIIGGLIGKGATGKDNGAAAGAVIGGLIAADSNNNRRVVTGYRVERQCQNVSVTVNEPVVSHYMVTFKYLNNTFTSQTQRRYSKGQNIRVYVSID